MSIGRRRRARPRRARGIRIYTDGACKGNPGPGGWGALLVAGGREQELYGGEPRRPTTAWSSRPSSARSRRSSGPARSTLYTDSQYVKNGIESWIHGWKRNGWKTADRKPVKNADLWRELDELAARTTSAGTGCAATPGTTGNERADALANRGVDEVLGR